MYKLLPGIMLSLLILSGCSGNDPASVQQRLIVQPDDGRAPILEAIGSAKNNIRLTIYAITDLKSVVPQTPLAPDNSIVQALIDKAKSGVNVRLIVDQNQYTSGSSAALVQQTYKALSDAGVSIRKSSTAFCFTHQKTFVIDGPTATNAGSSGKAIIMSLNLTPGYFGGTRDYAVITTESGVVREISNVFDSDFLLPDSPNPCSYAHAPVSTFPPPYPSDTPALSEASLLWSPVNSKTKLMQLIGSAKQSLVLTTEEMTDTDMVCLIKAVAQSSAKPSVRILLSGDTGSNGPAVNTLLGLGLPNLTIRVMPGQSTQSNPVAYPTTLYMHGKQVIVDGIQAFVGSENLTNTSLLQNRELGTLFTEPAMINRLQSVFNNDFTSTGSSNPAQVCPSCKPIACPVIP
jgi:phosphatidylserine/phosphatidylglycerophosphate/cardiolipin synthase-like enzyme